MFSTILKIAISVKIKDFLNSFPSFHFYQNLLLEKQFNRQGILTKNPILTSLLFPIAVIRTPRIITSLRHTTILPRKHQPIGTIVQLRLPIDTLPIPVAIRFISGQTGFCFAWILLIPFHLTIYTICTWKRFYIIHKTFFFLSSRCVTVCVMMTVLQSQLQMSGALFFPSFRYSVL